MSDVAVVVPGNERVSHTGNGQAQMLGLDVQFSKMLGDVVVENYLKQLTEEDMQLIIDYMSADLFDYVEDCQSEDSEARKKIIKQDWEEKDGRWDTRTVKSVGTQVKEMFNQAYKEHLKTRIEELIQTKEYQDKVDVVAHDVLNYCLEGYKQDLINSIREKLIGNILNNNQYYGGISIQQCVAQAIGDYIH